MASTQIIGGIGGQYDIVFDATKAYTVQFSYNGNQIVKNKIIIKDNTADTTVYENTITSMAKRHTIPAGTLTNGTTYNMTIQVYYQNDDGQEVADTLSDTALIKCYSAPVLTFTNMKTTIRNATYGFELSYSQSESDYVNSYQVSMYDANNQLLYTRDAVYPASSDLPYVFAVKIGDLIDQSTYYIECSATSVSGMTATTGRIQFTVAYNRPPNYSVIYADNISSACSVRIASNIKIIDGNSKSGDDITYIDDAEADLTNETAVWDEMLDVSGSFQILLEVRDIVPYANLLVLDNGTSTITLKTMKGLLYGESSEKFYLELFVSNGIDNYMVVSNTIDIPNSGEKCICTIFRNKYLYNVTIRKE